MRRPDGITTIRQAIEILRWNERGALMADEYREAQDIRMAYLAVAGMALANGFITADQFDLIAEGVAVPEH